MKLSASQAAKSVGKSIPTITRAIKNGKLSAVKLDGGGYEIEASELYRVWPAVTGERVSSRKNLASETHIKDNVLRGEVDALRKQIDLMEAERERERSQLSETIEDLRKRLDAESSERRALTAQITDQREKHAVKPKSNLWKRLIGS